MSDEDPYFCPLCAGPMKTFAHSAPRQVGPSAEQAGGCVAMIWCPVCKYGEVTSDEFFSPPSDTFQPPRAWGLDALGEAGP